jgi:hypothetical protein
LENVRLNTLKCALVFVDVCTLRVKFAQVYLIKISDILKLAEDTKILREVRPKERSIGLPESVMCVWSNTMYLAIYSVPFQQM